MTTLSSPAREASPAAERRGLGWLTWLAVGLGVLVSASLVKFAAIEGDTDNLLRSLDGTLGCLSAGVWGGCPAASQWPLLQYVPALVLRWRGLSTLEIGYALAYASIAAFAALLVVTWHTLARRSRPVAVGAVLVLSSGLLIHYSNRSFGEMLAAFVTAALAASLLLRRGAGLVALVALLTTLSKETSPPFLVVLGAACLSVHRSPGMSWRELVRAERGRVVGLGLGLGLGVALSVVANLFRYGKPYNAAYFALVSWAPQPLTQLEFFVSLWVAPNAGLLFFWPALVLLLVALPLAHRRLHRRVGGHTNWAPLGLLALMLVLLCAMLSRWWAPFGWWAWGSRLILPWLPAILLVALFAYAEAAEALIQPLVATRLRALGLSAVLIIAMLPHVVSIFQSHEVVIVTFTERGICPVPDSPQTTAVYYPCINDLTWHSPSPLIRGYSLLPMHRVRLRALLFASLLALGGVWLWREARWARRFLC